MAGSIVAPLPPGFVRALVTYAEVLGDAGRNEITDQFKALFAKINAGDGKTLINTSPNGKTFGFQVTATVDQYFAAYGQALREINGCRIVGTRADFSQLTR